MKLLFLMKLYSNGKISENSRNVTSVLKDFKIKHFACKMSEFPSDQKFTIEIKSDSVLGNILKLYRNLKSAFMVKPIFTAIMFDLSQYLNVKYPGEKFAVMMDNCPSHSLLKDLPHENIELVMLPPNCTVTGSKIPTN